MSIIFHVLFKLALVLSVVVGARSQVLAAGERAANKDRVRIVYTQDPQAFAPDGPAARLRQSVEKEGRIEVAVGLRMVMRPEHSLPPADAAEQKRALAAIQDAVLTRTLGRRTGVGITRVSFIPYMYVHVDARQLGRLLRDPQVASVRQTEMYYPQLSDSTAIINADELWTSPVNVTGEGYRIAVLDSGVDKNKRMLSGKVVGEGCFSTKEGRKEESFCPRDNPTSGMNCPAAYKQCLHGTHVAAIAAGDDGTAKGVAPGAKIISFQVMRGIKDPSRCPNNERRCISSRESDVTAALNYLYENFRQNLVAINMSFGGFPHEDVCDDDYPDRAAAFANFYAAGIAPVVAVGNDGWDDLIASPSCLSTAFAVANATKKDELAGNSNYSALVDVVAPGVLIKMPDTPRGVSGTSYAAPHVAGAVALLKQAKPDATLTEILDALTCSGKPITHRQGTTEPFLQPKKRIDLLGAYNQLLYPETIQRSWAFSTAKDATDWKPFRGRWVSNQGYGVSQEAGWLGTSVTNCLKSFEINAVMRQTSPESTRQWNSGLLLKAGLDYQDRSVQGYFFAYDGYGYASVYRFDKFSFETGEGTGSLLCERNMPPPSQGDFNTLTVTSDGTSYLYYFNDRLVCNVAEDVFKQGAVMAAAFIPTPADGRTFELKSMTIDALAADPVPLVFNPSVRPKARAKSGRMALR